MISFVLVNYNTKDLTYQAINSIINCFDNQNSYEIILVDNASSDGSKEFFLHLEKELHNFIYIYNNQNLGFGKANNIGFKYSKGDYIYLLNSDTILHTKNIHNIIKEKFQKYPRTGVIATKVQYPNGSLQPNVQNFSNLKAITLRLLRLGRFVRSNKLLFKFFTWLPFKPRFIKTYLDNFNEERKEGYIEWASGCSLIFRRDVYEELNGFDENFFMYNEDEEICLRVHKLGYKILYTPDILVTHFEGYSNKNKKLNEFLIRVKVESEFYYYKKHFPDKLKKLKFIYWIISFLGSPFSKRLRIIRETLKDLDL